MNITSRNKLLRAPPTTPTSRPTSLRALLLMRTVPKKIKVPFSYRMGLDGGSRATLAVVLVAAIFASTDTKCAKASIIHFGLNTGAFLLGWEYSEESVVVSESGIYAPLNTTAHSLLTRPNYENISAPIFGTQLSSLDLLKIACFFNFLPGFQFFFCIELCSEKCKLLTPIVAKCSASCRKLYNYEG
jgi:hypothetical protein